jgi:hypothetical protein
MALFYELHPALPRLARQDLIADDFIAEALAALGTRNGADAPD